MPAGKAPGIRLELPAEVVPAALARRVGQDVIAGIRAEAVSLATEGGAPGRTQQHFEALVEVIEPTGADTLAVLAVGDQEFTVRLAPDVALQPGQTARFLVDLSKLVCFDPATEALIA